MQHQQLQVQMQTVSQKLQDAVSAEEQRKQQQQLQQQQQPKLPQQEPKAPSPQFNQEREHRPSGGGRPQSSEIHPADILSNNGAGQQSGGGYDPIKSLLSQVERGFKFACGCFLKLSRGFLKVGTWIQGSETAAWFSIRCNVVFSHSFSCKTRRRLSSPMNVTKSIIGRSCINSNKLNRSGITASSSHRY